ncbi:MAG: FecR family protein [Flavobacteriia bacterium]|nr:FecR family protein [Flavobacteriia bacterium]
MNEDKYTTLIVKYLTNEISQEERDLLDGWIKSSDNNLEIFEKYESIWKLSSGTNNFEPDLEQALIRFNQNILQRENKTARKSKTIRLKYWIGTAASILFVIGFYFMNNPSKSSNKVIAFQTSEKENILPDGSHIWLNKGTNIQFDSIFDTRIVELNGEAFFDVERNPQKPFEINCAQSHIKVLGTSFNIRAYSNEKFVEVTVASGTVEVSNDKQNQKVKITKNQKAIINTLSGEIELGSDMQLNDISWKNGELKFENESLIHIATSLSKYFNTDIQVTSAIENCKFTFSFKNPELDQILTLFENYYQIQKSSDLKKIIISGESCD